jgi:hypothetical protein
VIGGAAYDFLESSEEKDMNAHERYFRPDRSALPAEWELLTTAAGAA